MNRWLFTCCATALITFSNVAPEAVAQAYPTRPVRLIVAQPPGGTVDATARIIAVKLSELWKQPVVVENHPGAGGTIGTDLVAKAPPDGYTLSMSVGNQHTINQWLYAKLPFDPVRDFEPVAMVNYAPMVIAVNPKSSAQTLAQFVELAKSRPRQITYSSAGNGTFNHLAGAAFALAAAIDVVHVPYKGTAPAVSDAVAGHVDANVGTVAAVQPFVKQGTLRALAVTSAKRSKALPNTPTVQESGYSGFDIAPWNGVFAPAGTPPDIVAKVNADLRTVLQNEDVVNAFSAQGMEAAYSSPTQLRETVQTESAKWGDLIKAVGVKLD